MLRVACRSEAYHARSLFRAEGLLPTVEVMIERFGAEGFVGINGIGARRVCRWTSFGNSTILTNRALPRVLVIVGALLDNRLEGCIREGVTAETKLLNHGMVLGEESAKHESDLEGGSDADAPHFESTECLGESSFQGDDRFLIDLLDVDEVEYISKGINGARRVEVLIDVGDHLKTLSIESMLFDK
jgi:hypothetical protein